MRAVLLVLATSSVAASGCAEAECTTCPTAALTANGATELALAPGAAVSYAWMSTHADAASSTVTVRPAPDACGNADGPWVVHTLTGSLPPSELLPCQAGTTYTLTFAVTQAETGETAEAVVTIAVD